VDAVITRPPDGEPAYLQPCDGAPGVAIYPAADAAPGETVPVAAASGPDADVSAIVEVDPASITCEFISE